MMDVVEGAVPCHDVIPCPRVALRGILRVGLNISSHEVTVLIKWLSTILVTIDKTQESHIAIVVILPGIHEIGHTGHLAHAKVAIVRDGRLLNPLGYICTTFGGYHDNTCCGT